MNRRDFITLLGGAAAARPLAARAQQPATPLIGWMSTYAPDAFGQHLVGALRQGLSAAGYTEGRNLAIEYRWADGQFDRLPTFAAEFVRRQVTLIAATGGGPSALAAKRTTNTIPIVVNVAADPVMMGLVASLNRPGGNLTGVTSLNTELVPKRMELLHEVIPPGVSMGVLVNPTGTDVEAFSKNLPAAASAIGHQVRVLQASTERDFDDVFATLREQRIGSLVIGSDPFFNSHSEQIAALALRYAVPAIYQFGTFVAAGGLMSYGTSITEIYQLVGSYAGRILKGEKPADLPVQQSTKIELVINLKTAKALGLTVPLTLLGRADEIIE
jgi:putative ABC transport system substrate-binding protein